MGGVSILVQQVQVGGGILTLLGPGGKYHRKEISYDTRVQNTVGILPLFLIRVAIGTDKSITTNALINGMLYYSPTQVIVGLG